MIGTEPAPSMTDRPLVVIDGVTRSSRDPIAAVREVIGLDLARPARTPTGLPQLAVTTQASGRGSCGFARPRAVRGRVALRLVVDHREVGSNEGCPLTIEIYRTARGAIDTVLVSTAID